MLGMTGTKILRVSVPWLLALAAGCGSDSEADSGPGKPSATTGTVSINATPDALDAPWTLTRPAAADTSGTGDAQLASLPPGDYSLAWGAVAGYNTPGAADRSLVAGGTAAFDGVYTQVGGPAAIVVDHRAILAFDNGDIPAFWIEEVKRQGILLHMPGRSHAQQLVGDLDDSTAPRHIGGLLTLADSDPTYAVAIQCALEDLPAAGALRVLKGQYHPDTDRLISTWECRFDDSDYWSTETGRRYTEATAAHAAAAGDPIDASLFGWSYHVIMPDGVHTEAGGTNMTTFNDERRDTYLAAMTRFNTHDSGTVFVLGTTPTDNDYNSPSGYLTEDGWRVTRYNADLRAAAVAGGAILLDQAEMENWNADFTARRAVAWDGHDLELRHGDWDGGDCAHGGMGLCVAKAKAMWWLAARLAGWDGTP